MGKIKLLIISFAVLFVFVMFLRLFSLDYTGYSIKEQYNTAYALNNLDEFKNLYNENTARMPNYIKTVFGNEIINAVIAMDSGKYEKITLTTEKGIIQDVRSGSSDKPTIIIETSEKTLNYIMASAKPTDEFKKAMLNKEIKYNAVDISTKAKAGIGYSALKVINWWDSFFGGYTRK